MWFTTIWCQNKGTDCGSDRNLLVRKLRLRFKKLLKNKILLALDFTGFCDHEIRQKYQLELYHKSDAFENLEHTEERWNHIKKAVTEAAQKTNSRNRGTWKRQWVSKRGDLFWDEIKPQTKKPEVVLIKSK